MNDFLVIFLVVAGVLSLFLLCISLMFQFVIYTNTINNTAHANVLKIRLDGMYERLWKIENIVQTTMHASNNLSEAIHAIASESSDAPQRAIRTPGGIVLASSLEDFLAKVQNDPSFKGISKEQLDELRKLFEQDITDSGEDDDENSPPWGKSNKK